jgi:GMP synthase-like glutamine amidotransferase
LEYRIDGIFALSHINLLALINFDRLKKVKYTSILLWFVVNVAIIENSPGLGGYFTRYMSGVEYRIFPVWETPTLPKNQDNFSAYIFTGDFNNISDGILPIHEAEIELVRSLENKKIFGSCFFHQLIGKIYGGVVRKRQTRFFGWYKMSIQRSHPIFVGLREPYFLNMNVDELVTKPHGAKVLATHPDCKLQVLSYGDHILTCQSHPEILLNEGLESIKEHRESLLQNCPDLDDMLNQTKDLADDDANNTFMLNIINWLLSQVFR